MIIKLDHYTTGKTSRFWYITKNNNVTMLIRDGMLSVKNVFSGNLMLMCDRGMSVLEIGLKLYFILKVLLLLWTTEKYYWTVCNILSPRNIPTRYTFCLSKKCLLRDSIATAIVSCVLIVDNQALLWINITMGANEIHAFRCSSLVIYLHATPICAVSNKCLLRDKIAFH